MNMLSTISRLLLSFWVGGIAGALADEYTYPVEGEVDLSSTFCDFRPLHFHGGIDIRTDSKIGREIFSPVNGYIWRIKYSYIGYGKAVYIKDEQGYVYVFGHLSRLSDQLEEVVKEIQFSQKSYCFDRYFGISDLPVVKGQLFAYSGQTGFGAPHLHFEKRTPDNRPLHPLTNGFGVPDDYPPEFHNITLVYLDDRALFPNGKRRLTRDVKYDWREGRYYLNEVLYVTAPFGVITKACDRLRPDGPQLGLYRIKYYVDNHLYYEVNYESYDYAQTTMVDLAYDYVNMVNNGDDWHTLFRPSGQEFDGATSSYTRDGVFAAETAHYHGRHTARIELYDPAGNESELSFDFYYAPAVEIFRVARPSDSAIVLTCNREADDMEIDRLNVYITEHDHWSLLPVERVRARGKGSYEIDLSGLPRINRTLKVQVGGPPGWTMVDQYIPLIPSGSPRYTLDYQLIDGGLLFTVKTPRSGLPPPVISIRYTDGYEHHLPARAISSREFAAFYRHEGIKTLITDFELLDKRTETVLAGVDVSIAPVGNDTEPFSLRTSDGFETAFSGSDFYQPTYVELKRETGGYPLPRNIVGRVYTTTPRTVPLAEPIKVSFRLDGDIDKTKVGLYRLNNKNKWKWLDADLVGDRLVGESSLMGTFAAVIDYGAPKITRIYPPDGKTVFTPNPRISCTITDGLSDLDRCGDIEIDLDGRWQIPEYDFETDRLFFYPDRSLEAGRHDLTIRAVDRVGNERTVRTHFFVKEKKKE